MAGAIATLAAFAVVAGPHTPPAPPAAAGAPWLDGFAQGGNYTLALLSVLFAGLAIVLAVAGALAWALLRRQALDHLEARARTLLAELAQRDAREIARLASAQVHVEGAFAQWGVYERAHGEGQAAAAAYAFDGAIALSAFAKQGLEQIEDVRIRALHPDTSDRIYANLGYYLAERGTREDVKTAAALVPRLKEIAARYAREHHPGWYDLAEVMVWVSYRTQVRSPAETRRAIDALLGEAAIPQAWKDAYRQRYAGIA